MLNYLYRWIAICMMGFLPGQVLAQAYQVKGKLTDAAGEVVAYAKIVVKGQKNGIVSNEAGEFQLSLPRGKYRLLIDHLAYLPDSTDIVVPLAGPVLVTMEEDPFSLDIVEIEGGEKDPAYAIIRQVIEHKKDHQGGPEAFSAQLYVKSVLIKDDSTYFKPPKDPFAFIRSNKDNHDSTLGDTSLLSSDSLLTDSARIAQGADTIPPRPSIQTFVEMQARTYYQAPDQVKTVVEGYRDYQNQSAESGGVYVSFDDDNASQDYRTELTNPYLFIPKFPGAGLDFYQNLIPVLELGDRPFISPIHSTLWQLIYKFRLVDRTYENGKVVYEIDITPRNSEGPYFSGTIWVIDKDWMISRVDLDIQPSGLNLFSHFTFQHRYTRAIGGQWLLEEETYDYAIREGRSIKRGNTFVKYADYDLAPVYAKNFFRNEILRTDAAAFERDSSFWSEIRPMSLSTVEDAFVIKQDSISTYHRSAEYLREQDSIYNQLSWLDFLFQGITFRDRARGMRYYFDPIASQPRPFGVGGYRHAVGGSVVKTWSRKKALSFRGEFDYGVTNKDPKGSMRLGFLYDPRHDARAYVSVGDNYSTITNFTNIGAILSRSNFVNKRFIAAGHRREIANGLMLDVNADLADYRAINQLKLAEWGNELFGDLNIPLEFDPFRQFVLNFSISYTPFQQYYLEPFRKVNLPSKWPTFTMNYRHSIPGIFNSSIHFSSLTFIIEHEFRPGSFGISRWRVRAGTFPIQQGLRFTDYTFFRGSDPYFFANPLQAFQLLGPTLSTPNEYVEGHFLHDFGGALIDKIPLLKHTPLMITCGAGSLVVADQNFFHSEVYAGIQWPIRILTERFKIGAFYVTSYSNYSSGLSGEVKFGISFFDFNQKKWMY
ncbi:MAG: DUF5686 and carboxypeptidase regulatory-like domain-containing protein [Bacteroidia bacterium]|nr:DUF5686 and carboxypeptidase regulatory-like domain-containing protein [Bacteroidia bacterium]